MNAVRVTSSLANTILTQVPQGTGSLPVHAPVTALLITRREGFGMLSPPYNIPHSTTAAPPTRFTPMRSAKTGGGGAAVKHTGCKCCAPGESGGGGGGVAVGPAPLSGGQKMPDVPTLHCGVSHIYPRRLGLLPTKVVVIVFFVLVETLFFLVLLYLPLFVLEPVWKDLKFYSLFMSCIVVV